MKNTILLSPTLLFAIGADAQSKIYTVTRDFCKGAGRI
jgi:hypothetical protein